VSELDIKRADIFAIPTWRTRLPGFEPHLDQTVADLMLRWEAGEFREHGFGYGYNSNTGQFSEASLAKYPYLAHLRDGFIEACDRILSDRQTYASRLRYEVTTVNAWFRIQTPQETAFPWHHHAPAVLSGCYFLQIPHTPGADEGKLLFQNPEQADLFMPRMIAVEPAAGDLVLFPSRLMHMPTPSPSAQGLRIGINMDLFVSWNP
jgi:putative 2-oxoglutarate-Fe(II)-dependent oxygenase superfamily protein